MATLTLRKLHPLFAAEVTTPLALAEVHDPATLQAIRDAMDRYAVLVFRNQRLDDAAQMAFARRLDGELHDKTGSAAMGPSRLGTEAVADISNVDEVGRVLAPDDRRRMYALGNRLWHTDASFQDPPGRYSLLSARVAHVAGLDHIPDLLQRTRATPSQDGKGREARFRNLADALRPHPRRIAQAAGRHVLLVDDVMTSGATLAAAADALKGAGVAEVSVLVLARVTHPD